MDFIDRDNENENMNENYINDSEAISIINDSENREKFKGQAKIECTIDVFIYCIVG